MKSVSMKTTTENPIPTGEGTRGSIKKPGRITDYIRERELLPAEEIDEVWDNTPAELVAFQTGFAQALAAGNVQQFLDAESAKDYRHVIA